MKLKDLKPGMVVAIGSNQMIKKYGLAESYCLRAVIVDIGPYLKFKGRFMGEGTILTHNKRNTNKVLIATHGYTGEYFRPDIVSAQSVIMRWADCLAEVEKEKSLKRKELGIKEAQSEKEKQRFENIENDARRLNIPITHHKKGLVIIDIDDLNRLMLALLEAQATLGFIAKQNLSALRLASNWADVSFEVLKYCVETARKGLEFIERKSK